MKSGQIAVVGFPDDLVPAPASNFGAEKLKRLLQEDVKIAFEGDDLVTFFCNRRITAFLF